jgi:type IV pilus assembly protein PilB
LALLTDENQKKLEELLVKEKVVTKAVLDKSRQEAKTTGKPLFAQLVDSGAVSNEMLTKCVATVSGVPYVNLTSANIDQKVLALLPREIAERFMAVPLGEVDKRLAVAMLDANNVQAVDFLANKIRRPLKVYMASEEGVRYVLDQYHTDISAGVSAALTSVEQEQAATEAAEAAASKKKGEKEGSDIKTITQDSPISRVLSTILDYAVRSRASDVHVEPLEDSLKIRCRIDGVLREVMKLPKSTEPPLVSRIKILSNLKIDEHRIPQDGQFTVHANNTDIDLRIAISPVVWGEQVVIRLLDKTGTSLKLEDMGYRGRALRTIREGLQQTNGMILTSGPTGSGKSTSMYALIQEIKDDVDDGTSLHHTLDLVFVL